MAGIFEDRPQLLRPLEVELLVADASKAKRELCWIPKVTFKDLVKVTVDADLRAIGLKLPRKGDKILNQYWMNTLDRALCKPETGEKIGTRIN